MFSVKKLRNPLAVAVLDTAAKSNIETTDRELLNSGTWIDRFVVRKYLVFMDAIKLHFLIG
ncbi:MAG TPA: hypothetical protein ENL03_01900 [Phycisphaerae bacterium]|nr:hypothetical protein [Phycisphaerae bacterium]